MSPAVKLEEAETVSVLPFTAETVVEPPLIAIPTVISGFESVRVTVVLEDVVAATTPSVPSDTVFTGI